MAPPATLPSANPLPAKTFDCLEGNFCKDEILVRLIHFWEARNFKQGNILMGVELLLIDTKSTTMQGFISANRLFRHRENLKLNSIFRLSNFISNPSKKMYKVSSHKYGISFTDQTTFVEEKEGKPEIDTQQFRLRKLEELASIADTHTDLFDVLGQIRLLNGDNLHNPTPMSTAPVPADGKCKDMIFLHVQIEDGETARIYLWDKIAANFRSRWNESESKPVVLLLTTINPKTVGGVVTLSSTASTRIFFDTEVDETKLYLARLGQDGQHTPTVNSSSSAVTKLETVTLNEIQQFLQNETPQFASFICSATIVDVLGEHGWHFISCITCRSQMSRSETSLFCTNSKCKKPNNVGLNRYRFEVTVHDDHGLATFVIWDKEGIQLVGKTVAEVMKDLEEDNENPQNGGVPTKTPQCLQDIVGRKCKFQVKLNPYNFSALRQTISVSRLIEDNIIESPKSEKLTAQIDDNGEPYENTKKKEKRPRLDN